LQKPATAKPNVVFKSFDRFSRPGNKGFTIKQINIFHQFLATFQSSGMATGLKIILVRGLDKVAFGRA